MTGSQHSPHAPCIFPLSSFGLSCNKRVKDDNTTAGSRTKRSHSGS